MTRFLQALMFLAVAVAADADPTLQQIDAVLSEMEAAVLAGDAAAYLTHVDRQDPVFYQEQKMWAADLVRHLPTEFDLRIDNDQPDEVGQNAVRLDMTMTWKMDGWGASRHVTYPVRFVRHAETGDEAGWLYAGEAWRTIERDGVRVMYLDHLDKTAERVVKVLPSVREHVHKGFEVVIDRVQEVKLYQSMAHLQALIYLSYADPLGGWNEPGESIKILARGGEGAQGESGLRVLLAHEYGHVATFEMGPRAADMPWWVLEGAAELAAEGYTRISSRNLDRQMEGMARAGRLAAWEDLADFRGEAQNHVWAVYTQGHHMLGYISDRFGRSARNRWLRLMAQGQTIDAATTKALGLSFDQLDADWRQSLNEGQDPPE